MEYCVGIDLGGSNIAAGLVEISTKRIVRQMSVRTNPPRSCRAISADIAHMCSRLCEEEGIEISSLKWVGVATPGIVKSGHVICALNLGWNNEPFADCVAKLVGRPTYIANDANAAAYAEAMWGCGSGSQTLVAFTLGTGVGGGIVSNGRIWEGINGFAAELGHIVIEKGGRPCSCGKRGCLEAYCSATALVKDTRQLMQTRRDSLMWKLASGDINRAGGKTSFLAMARGDEAAGELISQYVEYLAIGISNVINTLQPDIVCIGGGISREGENLLRPLRERVRDLTFGTRERHTKVVAATFRNDAGIIGAALLGMQSAIG